MVFAFFSIFLYLFISRLWEVRDQGNVRMNQSGGPMRQFNAGNEGQNIGVDTVVFSVGSDRSIGYNSSFL